MSGAITLGPLLLPLAPLVLAGSAPAALALGQRLSGASPEVDRTLWWALGLGLVLARLAFVYEYSRLYLAHPLSIVDIRDGGWNATAGLIGAWMVAFWRERRTPALRRPLRWAMGAGTALYYAGSLALVLLAPGPGQKLPPLTLSALDGQPVRLDTFAGKPTVVNLWATWCPPCVREMPVLLEAQRRRPDVNIVLVNQGEDAAQVARWLQARQMPLRHVLLDPQRQVSATFKQQGYPTTLFFDARGELVSTRLGELSAATLDQQLESLTR